MTVSLDPIEQGGESVGISNGEWFALTSFAAAFGENIKPWNRCHDSQSYTPEELRAIASRLEQVKDAPEWLRMLADHGGANLS